MKITFYLPVFSAGLLVWSGCEKQGDQFTLSRQDVLHREEGLRGVVFATEGAAPGPYKKEFGMIGNGNTAGSVQGGEGEGRTLISWPAMEGYFYEGTVYLNASKGAFCVVRKVPLP